MCGPRGEGRTSLHVAAEHGHESNVEVLVEAGANLTVRDHLGLTPLDLAEKVRIQFLSFCNNFHIIICKIIT